MARKLRAQRINFARLYVLSPPRKSDMIRYGSL